MLVRHIAQNAKTPYSNLLPPFLLFSYCIVKIEKRRQNKPNTWKMFTNEALDKEALRLQAIYINPTVPDLAAGAVTVFLEALTTNATKAGADVVLSFWIF